MESIDHYLQHLVEVGGSDLHVKAGGPAYVRVDGDLKPVTTLPPLSPADTERFAEHLMDERSTERFFVDGREADFAYALTGVGRFRINAFRQRGSIGMVCRRVLPGSQTFASLGMPAAVRKLAEEHRGLVLVTGPTGSGKTTTTAAMISHINATRRCHIVTLEDPIEVTHRDDNAIIDQREVGVDTEDFASGLKAVSRQDPDVIFIGEMRDLETVTAALQAAETGHFVISTLHTTDARETVNRIVDMYPKEQQNQARISLANSLKGIVCQRLVPRATGDGRVAVVETLVMTSRIFEFVVDPAQLPMIEDAIAEGGYYGMQTFDQHLLELFSAGDISLRDALAAATNPHDFRVSLRAAGLATA
ncbi:type IV pilus twitching motility protein PilT [Nitriliruptor alkaliphilus]|uniref:type IV pilus twitching motility protein PilT n=1 Tax=Nitriliruptor alkaliphilus TaxID=427918 RepID=UPI000698A0F0|nr:PilT/PilU family type 4a pilus ATPase [Nitriliruptor alkaliphilus]